MNKTISNKITGTLAAFAVALGSVLTTGCHSDEKENAVVSTKRERNSIKEGNELYAKQRYAESEVAYKKALEENPDNPTAQFNLASAYLKQRGEDLSNKGDSLIRTADAMLAKIAQSPEGHLAEGAAYDRGNVAYKGEDYAAAIEPYKNALRRNTENNQARENLRLAQLKKQEQEQQNQDQNQDQDKNQDQDQNQDQKQDQKQNQDQQQQQEKEEDKDKQEQNQQNKQDQQQQQQQEQKQQQGGLSDASAQQILKAMEDKENGTRQKVELMKQGEEKRANRRTTDKPW